MSQAYVREVLSSNLGEDTGCPDSFSLVLPGKCRILRLGHDLYLPLLQFIIYLLSDAI
jgi:hypothetical protein